MCIRDRTCPVSLELVLACTSLGARQNTLAQIRKTLHIPNNDEFVKSSYSSLIDSLNVSMQCLLTDKLYFIYTNSINEFSL